MEELTLDEKLKELLKDFPTSNNYAYLFIRIDKKTKEKDNGCILNSASFNNSILMISQYLKSSPQAKMVVLNAVLDYFKEHKDEINEFRHELNKCNGLIITSENYKQN